MASSSPSVRGASASTAGDDFHELWALRKVLQLLDPRTDLIEVVVEGVPDDTRHAEVGEHGQAADITEVRRGVSGDLIAYEQLKYSTANPNSPWTWARLFARRSAARPETSVIGKLAGLFAKVDGPQVIRIVTNQPLADGVERDFGNFPVLLRGGPGERSADLLRLSAETGLGDEALADFLDAFDLCTFGSASRLRLETDLLVTLGTQTDADARSDLSALHGKIAALILPENRSRATVDRETLLAWLGAGTSALLYPADSDLKRPESWVERDTIPDLVAAILAPVVGVVRLSAEGGCGKTAFMTMLPDYLPTGSEVVLFDCYGGGLFLSADKRRHLPQQAFVQVANELAGRLGSPFVLQPSNASQLSEGFKRRIDAAAAILSERAPEARLVIVFDAADNARIAADRWNERCFLDELVAMSAWPANVRVVVTCRPGRAGTLGPAADFCDLTLDAFTVEETGRYVGLVQPDWPSAVALDLHDLTGGVPRRLAYAVEDIGADSPQDAIDRLMPRSPGMDELFLHRVREAGKRIGDVDAVRRLLCALARLPRPMPSWALAETSGLNIGDIPGLANDLGGLVQTEQEWSFQDEDFEGFAGQQTEDIAADILEQACAVLAARQTSDAYAAAALAEAYLAAGQTGALFQLAQSDPSTAFVADEAERRALQMRRLTLSLRAARNASDPLQAQALLLTASKAVRSRRLVLQTITGNLDLSTDFSTEEAYRQIVIGSKRRAARGELRLRLAITAADRDPAEARNHLRWWRAWASETSASKSPNDGRVTVEHLALEFEAQRRLNGLNKAVETLLRWGPPAALLNVADRLAAAALTAGREQEIHQVLGSGRWLSGVWFRIASVLLEHGRPVDGDLLLGALAALIRSRPAAHAVVGRSINRQLVERTLAVLEAAATHADLHDRALRLLERWWATEALAKLRPGSWTGGSGDVVARAIVLRDRLKGTVTDASDLLPAAQQIIPLTPLVRGQRPDEARRAQEDENKAAEQFNRVRGEDLQRLAKLLNQARSRLADPGGPELDPLLDPPVERHGGSRPVACDEGFARLHACDVLRRTDRDPGPVLSWINRGSGPPDRLSRLSHLVDTTGRLDRLTDDLLAVQAELVAETAPASTKVDGLIRCARMAQSFDTDLSRIFYNKALSVADELDLEAVEYVVAAAAGCETPLSASVGDRRAVVERLSVTAEAVHKALGDDVAEYIPWSEIIAGCAVQHAPTGLAVVGRWRDDDQVPLTTGITALLDPAASGGFPGPMRRALNRLASTADLPVDPDALDVERYARHTVLEGSTARLRRDAVAIARLEPALREGRWASSLVAAGNYPVTSLAEPDEDDWDAPEPPTVIGDEATMLARVDGLDEGHSLHLPMLEDLAASLGSPALRAPLLRALAQRRGDTYAFAYFLSETLPQWRSYPPVAEWIRLEFEPIIPRVLKRTLGGSYRDTELLEELLAFIEGSQRKIDVLLRAVEEEGEEMAPEIMITLAGVIAKVAEPGQRLGLINALIDQTANALDGGDIPSPAPAPDDLHEAFVRWLFALMADVDKRVRWRASHAARDLLNEGSEAFAAAFVSLLPRRDEPVFAKPGTFFYLEAARLQTAVVLERVALETPQALLPYASLIADAALAERAHVLIRAFLKEAALRLERAHGGTFALPQLKRIKALNRSRTRKQSPGKAMPYRQRGRDRALARYSFDDTDTLPYWYSPAANVFQIDLPTFEEMAERWICDVWQAPLDSWKWAEEPRPERFRYADNALTSHRHGSEPTVERFSRYLEWHAMFCVMGELLATRSVVVDRWSETFEGWLADHALTEPSFWLSDLLGPPPPEPRHWLLEGDWDDRTEVWLTGPDEALFEEELRFTDRFVVAGGFGRSEGSRLERVRVNSALVTPQTAAALAGALQTARNSMDFCLPDAGDDRAIDQTGFQLDGWLVENQHDPRIDETDPERRSVRGIRVRPSAEISQGLDLTFSLADCAWNRTDGPAALTFETWDRNCGGDGAEFDGWRLHARPEDLRELLVSKQRSLIVEVNISRRLSDDHDARRTKDWRIFVVDSDLVVTRPDPTNARIGRYWVRRLGFEPGVDTYGRWLIHRIVELSARRASATDAGRLKLEAEMTRLAATVLRRRDVPPWRQNWN